MANFTLCVLVPGLGYSPSSCWSRVPEPSQTTKALDCVPEVDGHRTWKNQDNTTLEAFSQLSKELCKLLWEKSHQQSCPSGNTESYSGNQFSKIRLVSAIVAGMLQG